MGSENLRECDWRDDKTKRTVRLVAELQCSLWEIATGLFNSHYVKRNERRTSRPPRVMRSLTFSTLLSRKILVANDRRRAKTPGLQRMRLVSRQPTNRQPRRREYGRPPSPVKAGHWPPPPSAKGLDRACCSAFVSQQGFDGEVRLMASAASQFTFTETSYPDWKPSLLAAWVPASFGLSGRIALRSLQETTARLPPASVR
jgi:hypothetical protein